MGDVHVRPCFQNGREFTYMVDRYSGSGKWMGSSYYDTKKEAQEGARRFRRIFKKLGHAI